MVGILIAYLVRAQRRDRLAPVWIGIAIAVAISIGFGALLTVVADSMGAHAEQIFAGTMTFIAVGFVTWMIFWMRKTSHKLKGELQGKMDHAIDMGSLALAVMAAVAVGREGLETARCLWTNDQAASGSGHPAVGGVLGLLVAATFGYLLYKRAVNFNLSTFFKITGALLIIVAAGVLAYGIHEFQELGWLPGEDALAVNISSWFDGESWYGSLAKGLFNFTPAITVLQMVAWFAYVLPTMFFFFRSSPVRPAPAVSPESPASAADSTEATVPI